MKHELSKERLEEIAADGFVAHGEIKAMARALLAAHEQEPVMYASQETLFAAKDGEHLLRTLSKPSGECVIPLFTHPAPVMECEQEPVAYMYRDNLHADARFSLEPRFSNWSPEDINEYEISETPLYANPVPPIPASVPDDVVNAAYERHLNGVLCGSNNKQAAIDFLNACRAGMPHHSEQPLDMVKAEPALPPNSFTNGDLESMAHGDNPVANAYRELLAFRRNSPAIPDGCQQWISDVIKYLEAGLESDGELEAQGSIDAKRLLAAAPKGV